ncbi:hypothetical protein HAX54_048554 [Datura stramonium]|uniref:Uncharacterized protein n=1 Tax=Datura stramonium TaxID=4076 RepID=A0ABS8WLB2_DATST|nr:hypothetical protein [Datura stramonium]
MTTYQILSNGKLDVTALPLITPSYSLQFMRTRVALREDDYLSYSLKWETLCDIPITAHSIIFPSIHSSFCKKIPTHNHVFECPSASGIDNVTADAEISDACIVVPMIEGNAILYAPLIEQFFSPWVADPKEVKSLMNLVVPKKFTLKKDYSCQSFEDEVASSKIYFIIHYVSTVDEDDLL